MSAVITGQSMIELKTTQQKSEHRMYSVFTCQIWFRRKTPPVKKLQKIFAVFTGQSRIEHEIH